jgi:hypothetical protein
MSFRQPGSEFSMKFRSARLWIHSTPQQLQEVRSFMTEFRAARCRGLDQPEVATRIMIGQPLVVESHQGKIVACRSCTFLWTS